MRSGRLVYAHAVVVIDRAAAHVRIALVDGGVDGGALLRVARPASFRARDDAGANAIAHLGDGKKRPSLVFDAHLVSRRNPPRRGIVGMDQEGRSTRPPLLQRHVGENRI